MKKFIINLLPYMMLMALLFTASSAVEIIKAGMSFGHISTALLMGSIFSFIGFLFVMPKSGTFTAINKIDTLRTSRTFGEYRHPLLNGTYFNKSEIIHDLESLARESSFSENQSFTTKELMQLQALRDEYKSEQKSRSASNLYPGPVFLSVIGMALGIIVNEYVFKIHFLALNILFTIIGSLIFLAFIFVAETYRSHTV